MEIVSSISHSLGSTGSETQTEVGKKFSGEKTAHLSGLVGARMEVGQVDIWLEDVRAAEAASEHSVGRDMEAERVEKAGRTG